MCVARPALAADADADGVPDADDACPDQPEDRDGFQDRDGCPDGTPDRDSDGFPDASDACPAQPGLKGGDGCPVRPATNADHDGDGIRDADDRCPDASEIANGFEDGDGCPDEKPRPIPPPPVANECRAAFERQEFAAALACWRKPPIVAATRLDIGQVLLRLGRGTEAIDELEGLAKDGSASAELRRLALSKLDEISGSIVVEMTPSSAELRVDDRARSLRAVGLRVEVGVHTVSATAPNHRPFQQRVEVRNGEVVRLAIDLAAVAETVAPPPHRSGGRGVRRNVAIGFAAAATLSLGAALAFEVRARNVYGDYEDMPAGIRGDELYADANGKHHLAQGLAIGGGALAVVAGSLWLTRGTSQDGAATRVAPLLGSHVFGVALGGGF